MAGKNQRKKSARKHHNQSLNELKSTRSADFTRLSSRLYSEWTRELSDAINRNSPSRFIETMERIHDRLPDYKDDFTCYAARTLQSAVVFRLGRTDSLTGERWLEALKKYFGSTWLADVARDISLTLCSAREIQSRANDLNTNLWWLIGVVNDLVQVETSFRPTKLDELGELSAVVADAFADLRTGNTRNGIV